MDNIYRIRELIREIRGAHVQEYPDDKILNGLWPELEHRVAEELAGKN
jgi:hypothetical protein